MTNKKKFSKPEPEEKKSNTKTFILLLVILGITFITFLPVLNNGFTNWDDDFLITQNQLITELTLNNIINIFSSSHVGLYNPLVVLSHAIEYKFYKLNPRIYHLTNLLLHLINTGLVYYLILLLSRKQYISFFVALLFGIHPLHVESVAWISERKDVLYTLFFLLSLILYIFYTKTNNIKHYFLSILSFVLSLLSKSMAVTLPVVLILIDYYNRRNYNKKILLEKIPYFIFAIVFGVITIYIQSTAENINKTSFIGLQNIRNASFAVIFYLIKLFIPTKLSCLYPYPNKIGGFYSFIYPYSIIILGIIILLIIYYQRNDRSVIFGLMFFIITISPVIQLLPVGRTIVADRYTYIPYIGLFYVIIEKLHLLQKEKINYFITLILLTILFYFASLTNNRCKIWSDSITLWTTDIKAYPELDKVAYNNLGNAYSDAGDYEKAISVYNRVISIDSQYTDAYLNRGNAYLKKGDYEKAINDYNTVIKLNPNHAKAYLHRASAYTYKKEYDKAIIDFNKAIELKPNFASFYYNRAVFYAIIKEYDKSISDYTKAIENNPKYIDAYINRGAIYTQKKEYDKAILDYTRVIELNPNYSLAYYNRAIAYNKKGEIDKAKSDFESFKRLETNKKSIK